MEDREFTKMIVLESKTESLHARLQIACDRVKELERELTNACPCDCPCDCENCSCKDKKHSIDAARALMAGNDCY